MNLESDIFLFCHVPITNSDFYIRVGKRKRSCNGSHTNKKCSFMVKRMFFTESGWRKPEVVIFQQEFIIHSFKIENTWTKRLIILQ